VLDPELGELRALSVRVRLTRVGSKKNPIWRVVVTDQRSPRVGRFIEMIGHYNPQTNPSEIVLDRDRLDHWIAHGAQPTNTVKKLMRAQTGVAAAGGDAEAAEAAAAKTEAAVEAAEAGDGAEVPAEAESEAVEAAEPTGS